MAMPNRPKIFSPRKDDFGSEDELVLGADFTVDRDVAGEALWGGGLVDCSCFPLDALFSASLLSASAAEEDAAVFPWGERFFFFLAMP